MGVLTDSAPGRRPLAVLALVAGVVYLIWRVTSTLEGTYLPFAVVLLACEVFALVLYAGFAFTTWTIRPVSPPAAAGRAAERRRLRQPTYDESEAVLRATLTGCAALPYPRAATYVLDDGRRPWVRDLAEEFGASYLTREGNAGAKAGNVNAALAHTDGELILILDADHVPQPDILDALIGYFADERTAFVQTPHEFHNRDSLQHLRRNDHAQAFFYRVVQPGKDAHGAAFWCGSAALIRRAALEQVGGVATETITEDFHTSIKLHALGWRSRYHSEPLCYGVAPQNLDQFLLQRDRWARGNLQVLRTRENPLSCPGLSPAQRVCYSYSLLHLFSARQRSALIGVLAATIATGLVPIAAPPLTVGLVLGTWITLQLIAVRGLAGGSLRLLDEARYDGFEMPAQLRAPFVLLWPRGLTFKVTPKEGIDLGGLASLRQAWPLVVLLSVLAGACVWRVGVEAGLLPGRTFTTAGLVLLSACALFEGLRLAASARAIVKHRQLRSAYRFPAQLPSLLGHRRARITDISLRGAALLLQDGGPAPEDGYACDIALDLGALGTHSVPATVSSSRRTAAGDRVSVVFGERPEGLSDALHAALFLIAAPSDELDRRCCASRTPAASPPRSPGARRDASSCTRWPRDTTTRWPRSRLRSR